MNLSTGFLLYVTLYRLTVLGIGALSIYLGFRLFSGSAAGEHCAAGTSSADVEAGSFKLSLTNFWPGTYFALFGTALIGLMLWQGVPQLTLKNVRETTDTGTRTRNDATVRKDQNVRLYGTLRQEEPEGQAAVDREWERLDKPGLSLSEASEPLSNIARVWQREERIGEALAMARLAYLYGAKEKLENLALFAELLETNGDIDKAAEARAELAALRKGTGGTEE